MYAAVRRSIRRQRALDSRYGRDVLHRGEVYRLVLYPGPYDTCPPKVRELAESRELHGNGRSAAWNRRIATQLDGHVRESMFARQRQCRTPHLDVAEGCDRRRIGNQHRETRSALHSANEAAFRQRTFQGRLPARRFSADAHEAVTPCNTLSEPDRKPRRSRATRLKPAFRTAVRSSANRAGSIHSAKADWDSSTRARSS